MPAAFDAFRAAITRSDKSLLAIVLGSGMGPVIDRITPRAAVAFGDVPGLVPPTVAGHKGQIIFGDFAERPVIAFTGRLHYYEGHPWNRVVRTVEVAAELGAKTLILTNASGGINHSFEPGSLMVLTRHLEWNSPAECMALLRGHREGSSSPPQNTPYSARINEQLQVAADECAVPLHRGVYLSVTGPTYETPAEIRAARVCGADAVGMSTTREALRAAELGMNVAAISCIANRAAGLSAEPLSHKEVLHVVAAASANLAQLLATAMPLLD